MKPSQGIVLATLAMAGLICGCSSGQYDQQREWALRECEKILDPRDRRDCAENTPHYIR